MAETEALTSLPVLAPVVAGLEPGNFSEVHEDMKNMSKADTFSGESRIESPAIPSKPEHVRRTCLKCDETFLADSRFNRICSLCRKANSEINPDYLELELHYPWVD